MPMLDPGFIAMDPMLADRFEVIRRAEVISDKGRSVVTTTNLGRKVGTVTIAKPDQLVRNTDGQLQPRTIHIVTRFALQGELEAAQPDQVVWRGGTYTVKQLQPYPHFGRGFFQVTAESMVAVDQPVEGPSGN